jgi:hypothetical protein
LKVVKELTHSDQREKTVQRQSFKDSREPVWLEQSNRNYTLGHWRVLERVVLSDLDFSRISLTAELRIT